MKSLDLSKGRPIITFSGNLLKEFFLINKKHRFKILTKYINDQTL